MKIIILGAGQVGSSLAETLSIEQHDVCLVDINESVLKELADRADIQTVVGHASYPEILKAAGAQAADLLIAVTANDEINMIACQVAYSLFNTPTKIARLRAHQYFLDDALFGDEQLPIDVFINPEELVSTTISNLLAHPGALQVMTFADDKVKLVAVQPYYGGVMVGQSVQTLHDAIDQVEFRIAAIFRNNKSIEVKSDTVIEVGDEVFFIAASKNIPNIITLLRKAESPNKRIMLAGGTHFANLVAKKLEKKYQVKLIERDEGCSNYLAQNLKSTSVLHGDCCDKMLLENEDIDVQDVFVALTDNDETNIISCIQAKRMGAKQTMALISRTAYIDLIEGGMIDIVISPHLASIGSILRHIRQGDVVSVHSLRRGAAEAIEAVAHGDKKSSKVIGKAIESIKLPKGTVIGAIVRGEKVIIPHGDTVIESDDHVVLFVANRKHVRDVEKLFKVSATFF